MENKRVKPDKLALKTKLYKDREVLTQMLLETQDLLVKKNLKYTYDLVNSYIEICLKRNKF